MSNATFPIWVSDSFHIIAHRGASGYAPENTMAAFDLAEQMGVTEIELDIQFSQDNKLMICHDPELSRYGHAGKHVSELSLRQLKELDMGSWFDGKNFSGETMITLSELFEKFSTRFTYHVEIKTPAPGLASAILDCIATHKLASKTYVTSFHYGALLEFASISGGW